MSDERPLSGTNFVFFGGSTGIGRAAAIEVAKRGASILIVGRGREAGEAAAGLLKSSGARSAEFLAGDLSTVAGIAAAAGSVRAWKPALHGIMHTAMAAFRSKQVTVDGLEFAFELQYFARAALNRLLVDRLAASGDGRIVRIGGDVPEMRLMGAFGAPPEASAKNAVMLLTLASARAANGAILRKPKRYLPERLAQDPAQAAALW